MRLTTLRTLGIVAILVVFSFSCFVLKVKASATVIAKSGLYSDIQAAVNTVAAAGGGTVNVPAGTFNFVPVNSWNGLSSSVGVVNVPAGVNIIGAPPTLFANGSVSSFATILVCPWAVPGSEENGGADDWFYFYSAGAPVTAAPYTSSRFANIELQGYRANNPSATGTDQAGGLGVEMEEIMNFRIDHCCFNNTCAGGVWVGYYFPNDGGDYSTEDCGCIDHCNFVCNGGAPADSSGSEAGATQGYGVLLGQFHNAFWDPNSFNVFGTYNNYTVVIENCWFSMWRHDICNEEGSSVIIRDCVFGPDFGFHTVDNHGIYNLVPGRSMVVYDNVFTQDIGGWGDIAVMLRAGSGLVYDNTLDSSYNVGTLVELSHDSLSFQQSTTGWTPSYTAAYIGICHDVYIWGNTFSGATLVAQDPGYTTLGVNDFTSAPTASQGIYTPLPYPCFLDTGTSTATGGSTQTVIVTQTTTLQQTVTVQQTSMVTTLVRTVATQTSTVAQGQTTYTTEVVIVSSVETVVTLQSEVTSTVPLGTLTTASTMTTVVGIAGINPLLPNLATVIVIVAILLVIAVLMKKRH